MKSIGEVFNEEISNVQPYTRSSPNSTRTDNYGSPAAGIPRSSYGSQQLYNRDQDRDGTYNQYDNDDDNDGTGDDYEMKY